MEKIKCDRCGTLCTNDHNNIIIQKNKVTGEFLCFDCAYYEWVEKRKQELRDELEGNNIKIEE